MPSRRDLSKEGNYRKEEMAFDSCQPLTGIPYRLSIRNTLRVMKARSSISESSRNRDRTNHR